MLFSKQQVVLRLAKVRWVVTHRITNTLAEEVHFGKEPHNPYSLIG
jgi:hypothetical protein